MNFLFSKNNWILLAMMAILVVFGLLYQQKPEFFNIRTLLVILPVPLAFYLGHSYAKRIARRDAKKLVSDLNINVKDKLVKGLTTVESEQFQQLRLSQFEMDAVESTVKSLMESELERVSFAYLKFWFFAFYVAGMIMVIFTMIVFLLLPELGFFAKWLSPNS